MKKIKFTILHAIIALLLFAANLRANNIQVSNLTLTGANTASDYIMVQFDINWQNSWRTSSSPSNWDAAWVFVKYRIPVANGGDGLWKHAFLNNTGSGDGATITAGLISPGAAFNATTNPALGAFIYRSTDGSGTFSITGAQLRWNYGANGVADNAHVDVQVFAIEMVYVPQGEFAVGSGGSENGAFPITTINTGNATTPASGTGSLGGAAGGYPPGLSFSVPDNAAWPNGFNAFYCQKYEITQKQYVDFLNSLTQAQANNRKATVTGYRYTITGSTVGSYTTTNPNVACNWLSWMDGAAYCDWAGLRPMTELEFEKACRGTAMPVADEYAWGTYTVAGNAYTLSNDGAANEGIATNYSTAANTGNASYNITAIPIGGPLRVGIFAAHGSNTGRVTAGASYYGIMDMSGSLWERTVTLKYPAGCSYNGYHGNGTLDGSGYADVGYWPGINGNTLEFMANSYYGGSTGVTQAAGSGFRGGNWWNDAAWMRTSDRKYAAFGYAPRDYLYGFRGVRSVQ